MKPKQFQIEVPIYRASVFLVVADTAIVARQQQEELFGPIDGNFDAVVSADGEGNFGIAFGKDCLNADTFAHECLHLTDQILSWVNVRPDFENDEAAALLHGWLSGKLFQQLCAWHLTRDCWCGTVR